MIDYKKYSSDIFSSINIVPFTDIVLVLLVVFMIAAPGIVSSGLDINLPGASSSKSQPQKRYNITMSSEGKIYFQNKEVSQEALELKIKELLKENPGASFILNADSAALHGRVVKALDLLRSMGAQKIYIGTVRQ